MKSVLSTCIVSLPLLLALSAAQSNDRDDRQQQQQRDTLLEQRQQERAANQERRNTYRSASEQDIQSRDDATRRNARLSPEERRALRRQIDEANQDISNKKR